MPAPPLADSSGSTGPPSIDVDMSDWIPIADVAECPPGTSIERLAGGRMVAVANVDGVFHAIDITDCP